MQLTMIETIKNFTFTLKTCAQGLRQYREQEDLQNILGIMLILFVLALLPIMPNEYYIAMRTVVCICLAYVIHTYKSLLRTEYYYGLIFGILLYNPIFIVHLGSKIIWFVVNALTLFFVYKMQLQLAKSDKEKVT